MGRGTSQYFEDFPMVCFRSLYAQLDFSHTQLNFLYGQLITFLYTQRDVFSVN